MTELRTMSVKRALTRLKTIEAQLEKMVSEFSRYSTESSKEIVSLVSTVGTIEENHENARVKMSSQYQKYTDLLAEYTRIKLAITKSNLETTLEIAGKTMTITESLLIESKTKHYMENLIQAVQKSERNSELKVRNFNDTILRNQSQSDSTDYSLLMAKVDFLIDREDLDKTEQFIVEFSTELHGLIDEMNVLTLIEV